MKLSDFIDQLIELQNELDFDPDVLVSSDAEGNGYNHLETIEQGPYLQDTYEVCVLHDDDYKELVEKEGYTDDDFKQAVILWP